jgi:tricorn protease
MRHLRSILPALLALATAGAASAAPGYYRFPAERGGTVVFTAEGDLWAVPLAGGTARRLTTHPAEESQAAIAPDGRSVAFVAAYDGVPDVYVMPISGGEPRRLSFDGGRVFIAGFDPRGAVVYASENVSGPTLRRVLRTVDPVSGATTGIPLADANEAAFGDDGAVYFTRYGLHMSGDNARDYRGGAMAQLWRWSGAEGVEAQRIGADLGANLSRPMVAGGRLYAVSDADGVANLWSMALDGSDRRQLTKHRDYEVRGATLGSGRIVYQHGADLRVFELASGEDRVLPIELVSDFEQRRERFLRKPLLFASGATFAPAGDRAVLAVRGRIALAGTGPLRCRTARGRAMRCSRSTARPCSRSSMRVRAARCGASPPTARRVAKPSPAMAAPIAGACIPRPMAAGWRTTTSRAGCGSPTCARAAHGCWTNRCTRAMTPSRRWRGRPMGAGSPQQGPIPRGRSPRSCCWKPVAPARRC